MQGFETTYYKLLIGEWRTSSMYGEDFLYKDAVRYFTKMIPIYRDILDELEDDEIRDSVADDYLDFIYAILCYDMYCNHGVLPNGYYIEA